eukprot:gene7166-7972_t
MDVQGMPRRVNLWEPGNQMPKLGAKKLAMAKYDKAWRYPQPGAIQQPSSNISQISKYPGPVDTIGQGVRTPLMTNGQSTAYSASYQQVNPNITSAGSHMNMYPSQPQPVPSAGVPPPSTSQLSQKQPVYPMGMPMVPPISQSGQNYPTVSQSQLPPTMANQNLMNQESMAPQPSSGASDQHIHPGHRRQYPKAAAPAQRPLQGPQDGPLLSNRPMPTQTEQYGLQSPSLQRPQVNANVLNGSVMPMKPGEMQEQQQPGVQQLGNAFGKLSVETANVYPVNLLERRVIVPPVLVEPPAAPLSEDQKRKSISPNVFRCTLNAVPETSSLLNKSRLPFGIYIHPFRDIPKMPVIQSSVITRCKICRTYINPFVNVVDQRRWQCNMCFRINDIPSDLSYDPITKAFTDPRKRPEFNNASVEFIAPSEYMLRPPQPAVFLFVLDVSFNAVGTGYLAQACRIMKENINNLPGDSRQMIGFITFNGSIHFYNLRTGQTQPQMIVMTDIDDIFIPAPDGLVVNLKENKEMILQFLDSLPQAFANTTDVNSATGAAMQCARSLITATGGRITVFQTCLPSYGPGRLTRRELGNMSGNSKDSQKLNPSTDFYKKLALECAGDQIAIDLFVLAAQHVDLTSLSCASKYSSGCVNYFPEFHATKNPSSMEQFENDFKHYLTRKIGFEAVMRTRCTRGLSLHTFHGNFFVRSTDLLSLPNVNPDHSFSMQIEIDDSLADHKLACFQAALLYTTSKGERRIRVHTLAIPVTNKLGDLFAYADQQAIASLLSKMAVDRTFSSSLGDAREALLYACQDCLKVYRTELSGQSRSSGLVTPPSLKLLPLYCLSMLKYEGFRLGSSGTLDSRVNAMLLVKTLPLDGLMTFIYPRLYSLMDLLNNTDDQVSFKYPAILNCSGERLNRQQIFVMDCGKAIYLFIGKNTPVEFINNIFNYNSFQELPENMVKLPVLDNLMSIKTRQFIESIRKESSHYPTLVILREDSRSRMLFVNNLIDDRSESVMSYQEFLLHLQRQINK